MQLHDAGRHEATALNVSGVLSYETSYITHLTKGYETEGEIQSSWRKAIGLGVNHIKWMVRKSSQIGGLHYDTFTIAPK
jgi:hypothetical protein